MLRESTTDRPVYFRAVSPQHLGPRRKGYHGQDPEGVGIRYAPRTDRSVPKEISAILFSYGFRKE